MPNLLSLSLVLSNPIIISAWSFGGSNNEQVDSKFTIANREDWLNNKSSMRISYLGQANLISFFVFYNTALETKKTEPKLMRIFNVYSTNNIQVADGAILQKMEMKDAGKMKVRMGHNIGTKWRIVVVQMLPLRSMAPTAAVHVAVKDNSSKM